MNSEAAPPVPKSSTASRRLKVIGTGEGWPRLDVPYLRLRGRWLEKAGFVIGRHVKIEVGEGRLTIEQVD
jgi:hypothetical protein